MKVGKYDVFDKVDKENSKIILLQMRDNLLSDLHNWKSTSGMYLLIKNQIDALDIALKKMESDGYVNK